MISAILPHTTFALSFRIAAGAGGRNKWSSHKKSSGVANWRAGNEVKKPKKTAQR